MQDMLKSQCKFIMLLGDYAQQKQVGWEVIFSELGFAGSGARKPWRELEGSALDFFAACSEASGSFNCVGKVPLKSQCKKIWHLGGENQTTPWLGVYFFFMANTVFQKP